MAAHRHNRNDDEREPSECSRWKPCRARHRGGRLVHEPGGCPLRLLIGDGQLNYGTERILQTCYAYPVDKDFTVTADYQLVVNPAYNADRGPALIFSGHLHGEF
jgi:hypothetical protein